MSGRRPIEIPHQDESEVFQAKYEQTAADAVHWYLPSITSQYACSYPCLLVFQSLFDPVSLFIPYNQPYQSLRLWACAHNPFSRVDRCDVTPLQCDTEASDFVSESNYVC